jgi:uncharacterized membrane protein (DUF2068 family)
LKLKLRTEHLGVILVSLFYAVVGVVLAFILVLASFRIFHVGVLAVLNLILAYGLFKMRKWSVKLLVALFLPQVVFGVFTLYQSITMQTLSSTWETAAFNLSLIVYMVLCFISLVYVAAKRKEFK